MKHEEQQEEKRNKEQEEIRKRMEEVDRKAAAERDHGLPLLSTAITGFPNVAFFAQTYVTQ